MLRFIFGRIGDGKTEYIRKLIADRLLQGEKDFIFIVPEQFSFDTEREMLRAVGAKNMLGIEILSFSRLAETVLSANQPQLKPKIDDGTRAVLMSRALEGLQDEITFYNKFIDKPQLLASLVTFSTELKQCAISTDALETAERALPPSVLKDKLSELTKITDLYNALVKASFSDDTDLLTRLAEFIPQSTYFDGKTVYIDAFDGFTKQERAVIGGMMTRCKDVTVALCLSKDATVKTPCVFDNIQDEYEKLKQLAAQLQVPIAKPLELLTSQKDKHPALRALEQNIYSIPYTTYSAPEGESLPVSIFSATNPTDESEFVAATIHRLLREDGYKAKDIAVIERRKDTYDAALHAAFQKYDLPFFVDKRQPIRQQPLMRYITGLLDMAADGISTENLLRFLKTGLTELSDREIAELENYATMWNIDYRAWANPFTGNPDGLGIELHERAAKKLEKLNTLRLKAVDALYGFRKEFAALTGAQKSKTLFLFLKSSGVDEKLRALAMDLESSGFSELAEQQDTVWDTLMQFLDSLSQAIGDEEITSKRYRELFNILLDSVDLGQIPQGLDMITVGAVDRIRMLPPRVVFMLGVNDGVFPENPPTEGILNDTERKTLEKMGVQLTETAEYKTIDERYFVYTALSLPKEKLFISYSMSDYKGKGLTESEVIREVKKLFPSVKVTDSNTVKPENRIECASSAFETMALLYKEDTELSASLQAYFENKEDYKARARAVKKASEHTAAHFEKPKISEALFGKDMLISASKAETFYKCPFSYFCKFGLYLKPLKKAEIDFAQSGTLMHYALEMLLSENSLEVLSQLTPLQLQEQIDALIARYIEEKMGGSADKDERFLYLLSDLSKTIFDVVHRLVEESKVSAFVPTDFELPIAPDGAIEPYKLMLENGGSLQIIGSVDRVDKMENADKTYFRIVDYKSGGKEFRLSDVFGGLNMQMLIYLFAIAESKKNEHYAKAIPAGVLYFPAKAATDNLKRDASEEDILESKLKNSRMDGVILENTDVILGMDKTLSGHFVNVKKVKDGYKGSLLQPQALSYLKEKVDERLKNMAESLQKGDIPVLPTHLNTTNVACKYCDFRSLCGYEEGDEVRCLNSYASFDKAKEELMKEGENV